VPAPFPPEGASGTGAFLRPAGTGYPRLYLAQLRKTLETDPSRPRYLLTEAGMGYRFAPDKPLIVG
jgi:hypothetical protein